jgi:hypothetical protein
MIVLVQNYASDPSEAFLFLPRCTFRINNLGPLLHRNSST